MTDILTFSEAIERVLFQNGGFATLKLIYDQFEKYRKKTGKTPDNTIQERVQRDPRFTRIGKGVYALTNFLERIEKDDLGYFAVNSKSEIIFKEKKHYRRKNSFETEKIVQQKIRRGQQYFRRLLLDEMKRCPITGIDDSKLLVASHIKPWVYCDNQERVNVKNGLLLSPLYDRLFDKGIGLITFTLEKEILISRKLSRENLERIKLPENRFIDNLDITGREEFLKYHRKFIFQG